MLFWSGLIMFQFGGFKVENTFGFKIEFCIILVNV